MRKTIEIDGMMCEHCVKHVKDALLKIEGINDVVVSLKDENAIISASCDIDNSLIKNAIEDAGYSVKDIK